ncbi:MAG: hypothetical protein ACKOZX_13115 [Gammaproteobacteria bacterium]
MAPDLEAGTRAAEAAVARRLAGTLIASIRHVAAAPPGAAAAIEFETKCGRVVHLTMREMSDAPAPGRTSCGLMLLDGPFAPPTGRGMVADLTRATRVAFAGRPRVIDLVPVTRYRNQGESEDRHEGTDAGGPDGWRLTFDTGDALEWHDVAGPPALP